VLSYASVIPPASSERTGDARCHQLRGQFGFAGRNVGGRGGIRYSLRGNTGTGRCVHGRISARPTSLSSKTPGQTGTAVERPGSEVASASAGFRKHKTFRKHEEGDADFGKDKESKFIFLTRPAGSAHCTGMRALIATGKPSPARSMVTRSGGMRRS
jgi:hypothetical protein